MARLTRVLSRHTAIYAASGITSLVAGLLTLAVLTHYLTPSQFGQLAIVLVASSLVTLVYNAGWLQGTMSWALGGTDEDALDETSSAAAPDRRRALTSGIAVTAFFGLGGVLLVLAAAAPLSDLLLGEDADDRVLVYGAIVAASSAVWRISANTLRYRGRPGAFFVASALHHLAGVAFAYPLLASGEGVAGAAGGLAIGATFATLVAIAQIRSELCLRFSLADVRAIWARGRPMVPLLASVYTIQLADLLVLSRFVPAADAGVYRVAQRAGALASYWTSSFHMAGGRSGVTRSIPTSRRRWARSRSSGASGRRSRS